MNYKEALDFLYNRLPMYQRIGAKAFNKDLTKTVELCKSVGDPQDKFKSVHIAGTNGKGSSAHALASILQEAGYKVGLYTSPHLKSYRERIRINGEMISEHFVSNFISKHEETILKASPSFFEITVVMAFDYFANEKVDIAIIETGLGGRLDSTNVITPLVSLITTIGKDHEDLLGDTLELIAFEKAGIIKERIPVVLGDIQNSPKEVIRSQAKVKSAPFYDNYNNWSLVENDTRSIDFISSSGKRIQQIQPDITSKYFLKNIPPILDVVEVLKKCKFEIDDSAIQNGLKNITTNTGLKGRWQEIGKSPLTICDVGHNEDGIKEVLNQLDQLVFNKLHFVFGTVKDKSLNKILSLLPTDASYYFCAANVPRALETKDLLAEASKYGLLGKDYTSVNKAIEAAKSEAKKNDLIFIGGSTFVVAEIENL
jgi:dihydrofolate synthase/folylpolyglutamate synthase